MAKNSIGGFFVDLGLQLDKNSFETGNKYLDGMTNGFNKLIGTARNAAVVLATTAVATSAMSSAELKVASAMGVSTEALDNWKAAASIAGVNVNGLVSSMGQLANVMNHLTIDGSGLEAYSKQLGYLKIKMEELKDLSPDKAYEKIISTAQARVKDGGNLQETAAIVNGILGEGGMNLFLELERKNVSIEDFLNNAAATQFMTGQDHENGANFMNEVNTLKTQLASMTSLLGTSVGAELEPYLKSISEWIKGNKDDITNDIKTIAAAVGRIAEVVAPGTAAVATGAGTVIAGLATGDINKVSEGSQKIGEGVGFSISAARNGTDYETAKKIFNERTDLIKELAKLYNENGNKKFKYDDLPEDIKNAVDKFGGKGQWKAYMNDGIMRPDGTVTQVAPDDWVFAARNVGDLAKAFIPQGMAAGAEGVNTFSIVQNFTINGSSDMAYTIRQQAYNGTREGLNQVMAGSSRRLQQMSGTR